jgi:RHS repeat-associated protein
VQYGRDAVGRITSITVPESAEGAYDLVSSVAYRPFGPVAGVSFANGRALTRQYDQNDRIDAITNGSGSVSLDFSTNVVGDIVGLATSGATAHARSYAYDDLSRLTSVTAGAGGALERFEYDGIGNRTLKEVNGSATPYGYRAGSHRLTSAGTGIRAYDAAGNTTSGLAFQRGQAYDDRGRLTSVFEGFVGTLAQYRYNARGERVFKDLPVGKDRAYAYTEAGQLLGEYIVSTSGWDTINEIVWLDALPVAVIRKDGHYLIEADHLGTPRTVVDASTDSPVWRWDLAGPNATTSAAFGDSAPLTDPDGDGVPFEFNLRFPGQQYDAETGTHYNYFRDYEPGTGRYIESDPIGLLGGMSTYPYVGGRPLVRQDRFGLFDIYARPSGGTEERSYNIRYYDEWSGWARDLRNDLPDSPGGPSLTGAELANYLYGQPTGVSDVDTKHGRSQCDKYDERAREIFESMFGDWSATLLITESQLREYLEAIHRDNYQMERFYPTDELIRRATRRAHGARD